MMQKIGGIGVESGPMTLPTEEEALCALVREAARENRSLDSEPTTAWGIFDMTPILGRSFPHEAHTWDVNMVSAVAVGTPAFPYRRPWEWVDHVFWCAGVTVVLREDQLDTVNVATVVKLLTTPLL